jgi:hypothetical protein
VFSAYPVSIRTGNPSGGFGGGVGESKRLVDHSIQVFEPFHIHRTDIFFDFESLSYLLSQILKLRQISLKMVDFGLMYD